MVRRGEYEYGSPKRQDRGDDELHGAELLV
jgi:hypothetical protein